MSDPTKYNPGYSFSAWQESNPSKPLPAPEVDNELADISLSVNQTIDALKNIRRSDGKLSNNLVTLDSLGPDVLAKLSLIGQTGPATVPVFDSALALGFASVGGNAGAVRTAGFSAPNGAGAALYQRMLKSDIDAAGYPAAAYVRSQDRFTPSGAVDATNGGYWVIANAEVEPAMFGASTSLSVDSAAAVQAAISFVRARQFGEVVLDRFYAIASSLTLRKGERVIGRSMYLSGLLKLNSDSTFFVFDSAVSDLPEVSNMRLAHASGSGTSGATFSFTTVGALGAKISRVLGEDLYQIASCALAPLSVNDVHISDCEFLRVVNTGLYLQGALNWIVRGNILTMKDGSSGSKALYMIGNTEGCLFSDNFFLGGEFTLRMDATKENKFTACIFDGGSVSSACIYDTGSLRSHFGNCWASTQAAGGRGIVLDSTNIIGFRWSEGEIIGIQQNAVQALHYGDFEIVGGRVCNWGIQAAATFAGIAINPIATGRFSIKNVVFAQDADISGNSWVGINVNAGTYGGYEITGCSGIGLTGALIADSGTSATALVKDNPGYNPRGLAAVTVGASPFTYTVGHQSVTLYVRGGTVSDISQGGGGTMYASTNVSMHLPANKSVVITYSSAPTIAADIH